MANPDRDFLALLAQHMRAAADALVPIPREFTHDESDDHEWLNGRLDTVKARRVERLNDRIPGAAAERSAAAPCAALPPASMQSPGIRDIHVRNDWGTPRALPVDVRPALDSLAERVAYACKDFVDIDMRDWRLIVYETTYQAARCLAKNGSVELPNLGRLDIVYGEHGQQGRLILAPEARP